MYALNDNSIRSLKEKIKEMKQVKRDKKAGDKEKVDKEKAEKEKTVIHEEPAQP